MITHLLPLPTKQSALDKVSLPSLENRLRPIDELGDLMEREGPAAAKWICALAPDARHVALACGPRNNGGDVLVAARWLRTRGLRVTAVQYGPPGIQVDRTRALARTAEAGVPITAAPHYRPMLPSSLMPYLRQV